MKPNKLSKSSQVRGKALLSLLVEWINYLKNQAENAGNTYVVNQSEIEKQSGIGRGSIRKYLKDALVEVEGKQIIKERDGSATVTALQNRIEMIMRENSELKLKLNSLRTHHLRIYEALSDHPDSFEGKRLLSGLHMENANSSGECPLCGSDTTDKVFKPSNVVKLKPKSKD
jgi:hypothetical protein